ncbi:YkoF family thiamine/hydroxymethylpyrimidine-binding protein [Yaniella halotolerans]|uniref:YkoF family thiamine/hydroxymethylpyrimidine-binding protein n=1 Tax=Yaniella halotolerans TaxID=225453 RepID=UPI0003B73DA9|nr:YkoF family thiamine/hydroxymethylpyrimidine-binding protein [Yaniella halotolerans]
MSGQTLSPEEIGIGMRISVHPHSDDYERIILDALDTTKNQIDLGGLEISTGEVSTYVGVKTGAAAQRLAEYSTTLIASASRASNRQHLTSHLLFSRGCPGEATCELIPGEIPSEQTVTLERTGLEAAAAWSLYPLADDGSAHMDPIYAAIDQAKASGVTVTSEHYATILRGDLADILGVVVNAWAKVGQEVPHVVSHVSVSVDSPSAQRAGDAA